MWQKVLPTHCDAFRLNVSRSYRQIFDRELAKVVAEVLADRSHSHQGF